MATSETTAKERPKFSALYIDDNHRSEYRDDETSSVNNHEMDFEMANAHIDTVHKAQRKKNVLKAGIFVLLAAVAGVMFVSSGALDHLAKIQNGGSVSASAAEQDEAINTAAADAVNEEQPQQLMDTQDTHDDDDARNAKGPSRHDRGSLRDEAAAVKKFNELRHSNMTQKEKMEAVKHFKEDLYLRPFKNNHDRPSASTTIKPDMDFGPHSVGGAVHSNTTPGRPRPALPFHSNNDKKETNSTMSTSESNTGAKKSTTTDSGSSGSKNTITSSESNSDSSSRPSSTSDSGSSERNSDSRSSSSSTDSSSSSSSSSDSSSSSSSSTDSSSSSSSSDSSSSRSSSTDSSSSSSSSESNSNINSDSTTSSISSSTDTKSSSIAAFHSFVVLDEIEHDDTSFTQGLTYSDGYLYESTGLFGKSKVRRLDPTTGEVLKSVNMEKIYFGEGLTYYGDGLLIQITWKKKSGFIYNATSLELLRQFPYETTTGQGWGITYDKRNDEFIVSDGSDMLHFWDRETLKEKRKVQVVYSLNGNSKKVKNLNELEFWNGHLLSNEWYTDVIHRIDPLTGIIQETIDFKELWPKNKRTPRNDVFNGISVSDKENEFFITGKKWPKIYRIRLEAN